MPWALDRAGPLAKVLAVMENCCPPASVSCSGFAGLASTDRLVRVSLRCTAWVPTYPISSTQSLPNSRCKVRFHCWVLGETNLRGTTRPKMLVDGMPAPLQAYVGAPLGSLPAKPCRIPRQGTKFGSMTPACGSAFGFGSGQPGSTVAEKNDPRQPA